LAGSNGTSGSQGTTGAQGTAGVIGSNGTPGATGAQGIQGSTGPSTTINAANSTSATTHYPVFVEAAGSNQTARVRTTSTALSYVPSSGALTVGSLTASGNVTAFSDERLKTNVRTIEGALDKIEAMRGVYFDKDGKQSVGVIAQEIEKILPEVVQVHEATSYKSVAYGNITAVLIEAIKELTARLTEVEKR
jgi:hypothetical protein